MPIQRLKWKIEKDTFYVPRVFGGKKASDLLREQDRLAKEKAQADEIEAVNKETDEAIKAIEKERAKKIKEIKGECAAITLAYAINALSSLQNKLKQEVYTSLTSNATIDLEGTINLVLREFGGVNQIGINLRGLSNDYVSIIKAMDKFYIEQIIPAAYLKSRLGKAFVNTLLTDLGFGFINGQYFSERDFYLKEKNEGTTFYRESLRMLNSVENKSVSLEIALAQLEGDVLNPVYRVEKDSVLYKVGKVIGYSYQKLVNNETKRLVSKCANTIQNSKLQLAYAG